MLTQSGKPVPLVAIDGKCMLAKAAFAIPAAVRSSSGRPLNGYLGFALMQLRLLEDFPTAAFAIVFGSSRSNFRDALFPNYKSGRPSLPEGFEEQQLLAKELARLMGICVIETPGGFEADDVLASLAAQAFHGDTLCSIVTADKDLLQVVRDPLVRVLLSTRGVSQFEVYDERLLQARYGVPVVAFADYRALIGDRSDAIPGVSGVGPATARKLIDNFGDIEHIIANASRISDPLKARLLRSVGLLERNVRIMRLRTDLPVPVPMAPPDLRQWSLEEIARITREIGLSSVFRRVIALIQRTERTGSQLSEL